MAKKPSFSFKAFNAQSFRSTSSVWTREAEAGMAFPSEIEQLLTWTSAHMSNQEGHAVAYGVFPSGSKVADAICEVVVTRKSVRSKWVKMLRIRLRPKIDDALNSAADTTNSGMRETLEIFVLATIGLLQFGEDEKANTIKIYGRTRQQTDFLRFLGVELEKVKHNPMQASMEGKFLVVRST
jgi:hypothetical protein